MDVCEVIEEISKLHDIDPERKLWLHVLSRAIKDYYVEDVLDLNAIAYQRSAEAWKDTLGLNYVCEMAGLDARLVRKLLDG